jgi:arylsulfatase A-like enzyme
VDLAPAPPELAGVSAPATWNGVQRPPLPRRGLVPTLTQDIIVERDFLYFDHQTNRVLRVGGWKIVASGASTPWELYNLSQDRSETQDLAGRYPERVRSWDRAPVPQAWAKASPATLPHESPRTTKLYDRTKDQLTP